MKTILYFMLFTTFSSWLSCSSEPVAGDEIDFNTHANYGGDDDCVSANNDRDYKRE